MKDGVIYGSGNSRFLKSVSNFKTLYPTYDAFVNALVAGTLPIDLNGINSAGWKQIADALNKANLLTDETAKALGLDPADNPQVNDALMRSAYKHDNRFVIGDTLTTIRKDLSENWALCNGDIVYRDDGDTNPVLYKLLDPGLSERTINLFNVYSGNHFEQMKNGLWCISYWDMSNQQVAVYNPLTGSLKVVSKTGNGLTADSIIGITWNGSQYVCCTIYSEYLIFYTSSDLDTWTEAARYAPTDAPGNSPTYGRMGFVWDGAAYRVACWYSGYQAHRLHTFDANFAWVNSKGIDNQNIYAADGLFCVGNGIDAAIYEPGGVTPLSGVSIIGDGYSTYEKYAENKYIHVPLSTVSEYIRWYDKAANKKSVLDISTKFRSVIPVNSSDRFYPYYCRSVNFDPATNELVFYIGNSDTTKICEARISANADLSSADNYTFRLLANPYTGYYINLLKYGDEWTNINGKNIRGPHPRLLPTISHDGAYTYIKVKEGE